MINGMTSALVSGASRGIGRAISLALAGSGLRLCLVGRSEDALRAVAEECREHGAEAEILSGDLTDRRFLDGVGKSAEERIGPVDILINNAGMAGRGSAQDLDLAQFRRLQELNLNVAVSLSQQVLPGMTSRKLGAIINLSSIQGRHTLAGGAAYVASKHALNGFTGCLFEDVREAGIKVSTIMPGFVETDLTAGLELDARKMIRASDVAEAVVYVLGTSAACCPTEIVIRPQRAP